MVNPSLPREKIPWFPSINYDLCKGAKECLAFCPNNVFAWDEAGARIMVANPYNCTVGCDNCVQICPNHAITFPNMEEFAATLQRLRSEVQQDLVNGKGVDRQAGVRHVGDQPDFR